MSKAQSLSINTIIIAALALLVLIVVIAIFIKGIGVLPGAVKDCATYNGVCQKSCVATHTELTGQKTECADKNQKCCVPVTE
jgi:hypothetical protein